MIMMIAEMLQAVIGEKADYSAAALPSDRHPHMPDQAPTDQRMQTSQYSVRLAHHFPDDSHNSERHPTPMKYENSDAHLQPPLCTLPFCSSVPLLPHHFQTLSHQNCMRRRIFRIRHNVFRLLSFFSSARQIQDHCLHIPADTVYSRGMLLRRSSAFRWNAALSFPAREPQPIPIFLIAPPNPVISCPLKCSETDKHIRIHDCTADFGILNIFPAFHRDLYIIGSF